MDLYCTLYYSIYYTLVVRGHSGARGGVYAGVCHAEYGAGIDARLCRHLAQACQQLVKHVSSYMAMESMHVTVVTSLRHVSS